MVATTCAGTRNGNEATEQSEAAFWEPRRPSCGGGNFHSKEIGSQHRENDAQRFGERRAATDVDVVTAVAARPFDLKLDGEFSGAPLEAELRRC